MTSTQMFTAVLFMVAKKWKQPKCPSFGDQINKLWYVQTVEFYLATERNQLLIYAITWINLQKFCYVEEFK